MQGAGKRIDPPSNVPLDEHDMTFFASVIDEFARADWSAHQLELAAMLARDMADMERAQRALRQDGEVVVTPKGHMTVNPYRTVIQTLSGSILSKRRSLGVHARAQGGEAREVGKRKAIAKGTEADLEDELLARPN